MWHKYTPLILDNSSIFIQHHCNCCDFNAVTHTNAGFNYPLVNEQFAIGNGHRNSGFSHYIHGDFPHSYVSHYQRVIGIPETSWKHHDLQAPQFAEKHPGTHSYHYDHHYSCHYSHCYSSQLYIYICYSITNYIIIVIVVIHIYSPKWYSEWQSDHTNHDTL